MVAWHDNSTSLGRFRLLALLGRGGMGEVHLAAVSGPAGFAKLQVLKTLRGELQAQPAFLTMLLAEARLAARLNHPNIVQTNEVGHHEGQWFIAMEYLEGQSLAHILRKAERLGRKVPLSHGARIIADALFGLQHAHELVDYDGTALQLVHRDFNPHNIFVTYDGGIKVLDFGIAKAAHFAGETGTGILKGKVAYMPPEQMGGAVDCRSDLFAAGVMLWESAVGKRLWEGCTDLEIIKALLSNEPLPRLREVAPDLDPEIEAICAKALAFEPEKRFATAAAMRQEIEDYLARHELIVSAHTVGKFVSELFADERRTTRRAVEERLRDQSFSATGPVDAAVSEHFSSQREITRSRSDAELRLSSLAKSGSFTPRFETLGSGATPLTQEEMAAESSRRGRSITPASLIPGATSLAIESQRGGPQARGLRLAVFGALSAAIAVVVWAFVASRAGNTAPTHAAAAGVPSASVSAPVAAADVMVRVRVSPPEAQVFLDNVRLASNPYVGSHRRLGGTHQVRAEAPGYVPQVAEVSLGSDVSLEMTLEREVTLVPSAEASKMPLPSVNRGPTRWIAPPPRPPQVRRSTPSVTIDTENPW